MTLYQRTVDSAAAVARKQTPLGWTMLGFTVMFLCIGLLFDSVQRANHRQLITERQRTELAIYQTQVDSFQAAESQYTACILRVEGRDDIRKQWVSTYTILKSLSGSGSSTTVAIDQILIPALNENLPPLSAADCASPGDPPVPPSLGGN